VRAGSPLADRSIEASGIRAACGVIVLAVRRPDGSFVHQPSADTVPAVGDVVIALGTADQQDALRDWVGVSS
jgi:voltage-gated potassium channel